MGMGGGGGLIKKSDTVQLHVSNEYSSVRLVNTNQH